MKAIVLALALIVPGAGLAADTCPTVAADAHPEAKPFGDPTKGPGDVVATLARAKANHHRAILVFGANWCHDSRALAGWFATPKFQAMLKPRYEIAWIDVGVKDKNLDLAKRFGLDGIKGTPTVLVTDGDGHPLNLADAPSWHDVSTRSEAAIYDYFAKAPVS